MVTRTRSAFYPRLLRAFPLAALFLSVPLAFGQPGQARATTGASSPTPARYTIALKLAQPFRGQYTLVTGATSTQLIGGAMAIDLNDLDYLFGISQFRTYDAQGHQTTILLGIYNFHLAAHGQLLATFYDPTDTVALGRLAVTPAGHGDLVGQITLGRKNYAARWHKNVGL